MDNKPNYIRPKVRYNKDLESVMHSQGIFENRITNKKADENEKWFNTAEASNYLRITPNALRILVHRAKVRAYKIGSRLRFKKSDLLIVLQLKED